MLIDKIKHLIVLCRASSLCYVSTDKCIAYFYLCVQLCVSCLFSVCFNSWVIVEKNSAREEQMSAVCTIWVKHIGRSGHVDSCLCVCVLTITWNEWFYNLRNMLLCFLAESYMRILKWRKQLIPLLCSSMASIFSSNSAKMIIIPKMSNELLECELFPK